VLIHFLALAALYHSYILAYFPGQYLWLGTLLIIFLVGYFTSRNFKVISLFVVLTCLPVLIYQAIQDDRARFPYEKIDLNLTVQAKSDAVYKDWGAKGIFRIVKVNDCKEGLKPLCSEAVGKHIELNDYQSGNFFAGQTYQGMIRLKPPLGFLNPGGFDYERWLYSKGIWAKGYFKDEPRLFDDTLDVSWRHRMGRFLDGGMGSECNYHSRSSDTCAEQFKSRSLLKALVLGQKQNLHQDDKTRLAEAGLIHLFVISGLHIGLLFGVVWWLFKLFLSVLVLNPAVSLSNKLQSLWINISQCLALVFVWWFVSQIDYPVPALRAVIFLSVWLVARVFGWQIHLLYVLSFSVWLILSLMPEELFSYGFWMSVLAVLALILAISVSKSDAFSIEAQTARYPGWNHFKTALWFTFKAQFFVVLLLLPFSIYFGNQVSVLALIWNMLLIPLFGALVVPLLLLASVSFEIFPEFSSVLFELISRTLLMVIDFIHGVNGVGFIQDRLGLQFSYPGYAIFFWIILCLSPVARKLKFVAILGMCSLFLLKPEQKTDLELWFLDVGQGLSVVLIKDGNAVLYDTGFKLGDFSAAEAVIVPFLRYKHVGHVDLLIVSHKDTDHSGGMEALIDSEYRPKRLMQNFSDASVQGVNTGSCLAGSETRWEDLRFKVIWPIVDQKLSKLGSNDSSCVVLIEYGKSKILLTGDVTRQVEMRLLELYPEFWHKGITVMSVPHHGSKTSSSKEFISALNPVWSIASSGPLNRFGHPHGSVESRYSVLDGHFVNTAVSGAAGFEITKEGGVVPVHDRFSSVDLYWRTAREE